jgi:hypothetical protein
MHGRSGIGKLLRELGVRLPTPSLAIPMQYRECEAFAMSLPSVFAIVVLLFMCITFGAVTCGPLVDPSHDLCGQYGERFNLCTGGWVVASRA